MAGPSQATAAPRVAEQVTVSSKAGNTVAILRLEDGKVLKTELLSPGACPDLRGREVQLQQLTTRTKLSQLVAKQGWGEWGYNLAWSTAGWEMPQLSLTTRRFENLGQCTKLLGVSEVALAGQGLVQFKTGPGDVVSTRKIPIDHIFASTLPEVTDKWRPGQRVLLVERNVGEGETVQLLYNLTQKGHTDPVHYQPPASDGLAELEARFAALQLGAKVEAVAELLLTSKSNFPLASHNL